MAAIIPLKQWLLLSINAQLQALSKLPKLILPRTHIFASLFFVFVFFFELLAFDLVC